MLTRAIVVAFCLLIGGHVSTSFAADDPAAESVRRGLSLCYEKGEWDAGLPLLAVGGDETLAELARADLTLPPDASPIARVVAGHDWWDHAQSQTGLAKVRAQQRAAYWYTTAIDELPDDRRARVREMIDAAAREADAFFAASNVPRDRKSVVGKECRTRGSPDHQ